MCSHFLNDSFKRIILSLILFLFFCHFCLAQSPLYSESIVKYDYQTQTTQPSIPFDRSFTLFVDKLSAKNIKEIQGYEVEYKKGVRRLVMRRFIDCKTNNDTEKAIYDVNLKWNVNSDSLQIF